MVSTPLTVVVTTDEVRGTGATVLSHLLSEQEVMVTSVVTLWVT